MTLQCEVVAIGTELLLGQIVDTNSAWIGDRLAQAGIDSHFQTKVGDNHARIVAAVRTALSRSDAVICCGGLGPTQDDITREALAEIMGVGLERDPAMVESIRAMFGARGREMAPSNARQADKPVGAEYIPQRRGTAPGLICPVGDTFVYAVPGVPHEMEEMMERAVVPHLAARAGETATIRSRVLRTWGLAESTLAELVGPRFSALDGVSGAPTIAFLASGMEGIKVRVTVKAPSAATASARLDEEEAALRDLLGDIVFGVDDQTMESVVGDLIEGAGLTLGVAESLTGGLVGSRLTDGGGASQWFRGSIVSYASEVKFDLLGVPEGPVVSEEAAAAMASGAARVLGADVGLGITGVAGPTEQDGMAVGTVFCGVHIGGSTSVTELHLPGDRDRVRQYSTISALDLLRRRLLASRDLSGVAPGWYRDPAGRAEWRWWDGGGWTGAVAAQGRQWVDGSVAADVRGGGLSGGGLSGGGLSGGGLSGGSLSGAGFSGRPGGPGPAAPWPTLPPRAIWYAAGGLFGGFVAAGLAATAALQLGVGRYSPVRVVIDLAVLWTFLVGASVLASRRLGTGDLRRDYGWGFEPFDAVRGLGASVCGRVAVTFVGAVMIGLFGKLVGNNQVLTKQHGHALGLLVVGAGAVIGAPIVEELFFRGLLLRALAGRFGFAWAVVIQGLVFGLAHGQFNQGWLTLTLIAGTATFGITQGLFAARYRLGALQVSHALFNLLPVLLVVFGATR